MPKSQSTTGCPFTVFIGNYSDSVVATLAKYTDLTTGPLALLEHLLHHRLIALFWSRRNREDTALNLNFGVL